MKIIIKKEKLKNYFNKSNNKLKQYKSCNNNYFNKIKLTN